MSSSHVVSFIEGCISKEEVYNKDIIEIGSRFVNGTVRWAIEQYKPNSYLGIDIFEGPCVDEICSVEDTFSRFEPESFDIVVSSEMLEHVLDFRLAINAMKRLCKIGGTILITTRSKGFPLHGYPHDFWRYEVKDMQLLFKDYEIIKCVSDPSNSPGVFFKATKIASETIDISDYELYCIISDRVMVCDVDLLKSYIDTHPSNYGECKKFFFDDYCSLYEYGARRNADKTIHGYLPKYEFFLSKFLDESFNLLELGVLNGSSIMMWHDYFKNAKIFGVDKRKDCLKYSNDRITIKILDLGDINSYGILSQYKYRIIVDDASHLWDHQLLSFFSLFASLEPGGIFIIEDLQTCFEPLSVRYKTNEHVPPSSVLLKISESVLSNYSKGRDVPYYTSLIESIARQISMISFIQKSCIIVKK